MPSIAVYCGSNPGFNPAYLAAASEVGAALAARNIRLVYGGGSVGLMGAVADAVLAGGGQVTGVITEHLVAKEVGHHGLTELQVVGSMHERKARMVALAHGVICLPGGFGTLDEMFEALTWAQLGLSEAPVVLYDIDGFWTPMFAAIETIAAEGFIRPQHVPLARRATSADQAIDLALTPLEKQLGKWTERAQ